LRFVVSFLPRVLQKFFIWRNSLVQNIFTDKVRQIPYEGRVNVCFEW